MANHKDALKRIRQNEKRRTRNRQYRSRMRKEIKKLRMAVEANDSETAVTQLPKTVSMIQHVAQKGVIHRRQAARRVSRLTLAVNAIVGQ